MRTIRYSANAVIDVTRDEVKVCNRTLQRLAVLRDHDADPFGEVGDFGYMMKRWKPSKLCRREIADIRIVYEVNDQEIVVHSIGPRDTVYK